MVDSASNTVVAWYGTSDMPPDPNFGVYQIQTRNACFEVDVVDNRCNSNPSMRCPLSSASFDMNALFASRPCTPLVANQNQRCNVWVCDVGGIDLLVCIAPPTNDGSFGGRYSSIISISNVPVRFVALGSAPQNVLVPPSYCGGGGGGGFFGFFGNNNNNNNFNNNNNNFNSNGGLWDSAGSSAATTNTYSTSAAAVQAGSWWSGGVSSNTGAAAGNGMFGGQGNDPRRFNYVPEQSAYSRAQNSGSSMGGIFLLVVILGIAAFAIASKSPYVKSIISKSVASL